MEYQYITQREYEANRSARVRVYQRGSVKLEPPASYTTLVNYCKPGIVATCNAGCNWDHHKSCRFAVKSTYFDRCQHYIEERGDHCDCMEAQVAAGPR